MKRKYSRFLFIIIAFISVLSITAYVYLTDTKEVLSKYGSRGQEVTNIQTRLKNWGYYKGKVDGIYGYQTANAVKAFQRKNGLKVDGIAGPQTLAALGLPTGQTGGGGGNQTTSNSDLNLLAHLIHGEGRGEPYIGQVAIGAVVLNRVKDSRFPKTIAGVIYQPGLLMPYPTDKSTCLRTKRLSVPPKTLLTVGTPPTDAYIITTRQRLPALGYGHALSCCKSDGIILRNS